MDTGGWRKFTDPFARVVAISFIEDLATVQAHRRVGQRPPRRSLRPVRRVLANAPPGRRPRHRVTRGWAAAPSPRRAAPHGPDAKGHAPPAQPRK